jgi:hypothetical protein
MEASLKTSIQKQKKGVYGAIAYRGTKSLTVRNIAVRNIAARNIAAKRRPSGGTGQTEKQDS